MTEHVIIVDAQDQPLGTAEKLAAHQKGLRHRAFSVFIIYERTARHLLLQQRSEKKYHCAGLWTNTCCGHPRPGENTQEAAKRRLHEEIGLHATLMPVGCFEYRAVLDNGLIEHEIDHVFIGHYTHQPLAPHPDEIAATEWVTLDDLRSALKQTPENYTPWLEAALKHL